MSKAKVISVLNHKGGVGKTTTTINLGGALRQKGYKVLLIDLDGQANLTESLGFSAELPQTIYGAMKGEYDLPIYEHKDGQQNKWYGFWNYGDVMHAYDPVRHTWR